MANKKQNDKKQIDREQAVRNLDKHFGSPGGGMLAHTVITMSMSGQHCDMTFHKRGPALDVKIDERIAITLMYGAGAKKMQEMLGSVRLSNGKVVSYDDIWIIFPMPQGGLSQEQLAEVDLAAGDEVWGPNGETVREMIHNVYHCKTKGEEEKYLRRYLAS
jgi:hypothetical protein